MMATGRCGSGASPSWSCSSSSSSSASSPRCTTENAQKSACKAELNTVESAVEAFNASLGVYPTNAGQLVNPPDDADGNPVGRFLRSEPKWHTVAGQNVNPDAKCAPFEQ
jgi:hypothetical protein